MILTKKMVWVQGGMLSNCNKKPNEIPCNGWYDNKKPNKIPCNGW